MKIQPLVSVLMTAYNREKYIAEAIKSVLASTHSNFELIIVDDCSTDTTVTIAKGFADNDSRIKVYINDVNLGDYPNRNKAASYAIGKYLKYVDSDDMIYPWGLAVMVMCMERYPDAGFGLMSYGLPQKNEYPILEEPAQLFKYFYFRFALISMGPLGAIFRRDAFETVGGFSGKPYVGDSEMWLKLGSVFSMVRMPLDLVWWREHEGQQIKEGLNNNYYATNQYGIYIAGLKSANCPLSITLIRQAFNNLQNVRTRTIIINYFFKLKIKKGLQLLRKDELSVLDLFKALRRNNYIIE